MKKTVYLFLTMVLVTILTSLLFIVIASLTGSSASYACAVTGVPVLNAFCVLSPAFRIAAVVIGALGGLKLGRTWWRIVYIEHRHWRRK